MWAYLKGLATVAGAFGVRQEAPASAIVEHVGVGAVALPFAEHIRGKLHRLRTGRILWIFWIQNAATFEFQRITHTLL